MIFKTASTALFTHGSIELVGAAALLLAPEKLVSILFPLDSIFVLELCCLIFGIPRLIAGYALRSEKSWGFVFALGLSLITIIVSPILFLSIVNLPLAGKVFALGLDIPLALIVLVSLLNPRTHKKESSQRWG